MGIQKHIIKRQTIELTIKGAADAHRVQSEVSRIYRQRLVPLIDACCSAASDPDQIDRVDRLEVDLGAIDPQHLEEELVAKLLPALRQALGAQIDAQAQAVERQGANVRSISQLELFAFFARTGSLPWWADVAQPGLLDDCLDYLLRTAPGQLRSLLRDLLRTRRPLRRIVAHYGDELLARLADVVADQPQLSLSRDLPAFTERVQATHAAANQTPTQLRHSAWLIIVAVASLHDAPYPNPEAFYGAVLTRIAAERGVAYDTLLGEIGRTVRTSAHPNQRTLQETLAALGRERPETSLFPRQPGEQAEGVAALNRRLAQLQAAGGRLSDLWAPLRAELPRFPAALQGELLAALNDLGADASSDTGLIPVALQQVLGRLSQSLSPVAQHDLLTALQHLADRTSQQVTNAQLLEALDSPGQQLPALIRELRQQLDAAAATPDQTADTPVDLRFSDADEIYVGNAGLAILWPFLSHFFGRLELLTNQRFTDQAAMQRAVGLLQHLASAETVFPEYLLPLNKLLCGMELTEVFDFGAPVSAAEAEECADLLGAIIAQAPILRDMSADGLRGTFLLREGILRARDGAWLLQVERETYDIVLDRFPWSWEWVKLPWMDAPLRVEWA